MEGNAEVTRLVPITHFASCGADNGLAVGNDDGRPLDRGPRNGEDTVVEGDCKAGERCPDWIS